MDVGYDIRSYALSLRMTVSYRNDYLGAGTPTRCRSRGEKTPSAIRIGTIILDAFQTRQGPNRNSRTVGERGPARTAARTNTLGVRPGQACGLLIRGDRQLLGDRSGGNLQRLLSRPRSRRLEPVAQTADDAFRGDATGATLRAGMPSEKAGLGNPVEDQPSRVGLPFIEQPLGLGQQIFARLWSVPRHERRVSFI